MFNAVANPAPSDLDITGNGTAWWNFRGPWQQAREGWARA